MVCGSIECTRFLLSLFLVSTVTSSSSTLLVNQQTQFLSAIASSDPSVTGANLTQGYNELLKSAVNKYSGSDLLGTVDIVEVKRSSGGNPFLTVVLTFDDLSRDVSVAEMLQIWALLSPSEASLILDFQVIVVCELVGDSLIEQRDTLDSYLWVIIPPLVTSFFIALAILLLCFWMQPRVDNHLERTSSNIFRQQRNPAWIHSKSKVDKLKETWAVEVKGEHLEREVTALDATTETIENTTMEEHDVEKFQEPRTPTDDSPKTEVSDGLKSTRPDDTEGNSSNEQSSQPEFASTMPEEDISAIQTQPIVSELHEALDQVDVLSLSAPAKIVSSQPWSLYDLWYYYRAFDGTRKMSEKAVDEELTLKKAPSQFSTTLEFKHPDLVEDPKRAIVEQTGKVPPEPKKWRTTDLDEFSQAEEVSSDDCMMSLGSTLYGTRSLTSRTLKPGPEGVLSHDEVDIAASLRYSAHGLNDETFRHMQAELRRVYSQSNRVEKSDLEGSYERELKLRKNSIGDSTASTSSDSF